MRRQVSGTNNSAVVEYKQGLHGWHIQLRAVFARTSESEISI